MAIRAVKERMEERRILKEVETIYIEKEIKKEKEGDFFYCERKEEERRRERKIMIERNKAIKRKKVAKRRKSFILWKKEWNKEIK